MRGVSSVLGAVILAAIVFTVLIPLLIFLQNTTTLYHLQVLERNRAEIERFQENLEIHATISPDKNIYLLVRNKGSLAANLTSIYIADSEGGLTIRNLTKNSTISPLSHITPIDLTMKAEEDKAYTIHAATERGRSYAAIENPLNLTDPPYLLQVSLLDMSYGENYGIRVEVTSIDGKDLKIGCIRIEGSGKACSAAAEVQYRSERWNDNQTFVFKVMPGVYELTVWNQSYTYPKQTLIILGNEAKIYKFGHTPACPSGNCCEDMRGSLKVNISAPKVVIAGDKGETPKLEIYVIVQLDPDAGEAIRDLKIVLGCKAANSICDPPKQEKTIDYLKPGRAKALKFDLIIREIPETGDYFNLTASLKGGIGVRTGFDYGKCPSPIGSDETQGSICKLTKIDYTIFKILTGTCDDCKKYCKDNGCNMSDCLPFLHRVFCICECSTNVVPRCQIPES